MKISSDAIKRIVLIAVVIGLFEVYEVTKRKAEEKPKAPVMLSLENVDTAKQNKWFKENFEKELEICAPNAKTLKDPNLVKLAHLYQSQLLLVRQEYPNAREEDQIIVAQNYFYTILNNLVLDFGKYYDKRNPEIYTQVNLSNDLINNEINPFFIAAIYQIGVDDTAKKDTFYIVVNTQDVAKSRVLMETKYSKNPSVQLTKFLFINQFNDLNEIKDIKESCFNILSNHPSF